MKLKRSSFAVVVVALGAALVAATFGSSARDHRSPLAGALPHIVVGPLGSQGSLPPGIDPPTCTAPDGTVFRCYTPELLQLAYDFPTGHAAPTGRGQTIVVIDAFGNPTMQDDLATFDNDFHVAAPPSFEIVGPNGSGDPEDPNVQAWQLETALDVEYAHALAPGANIALVVAATDDNADVNAAEALAVSKYPGAIFSHSFGSDETDDVASDVVMHRLFVLGQRLGDTFVAGTGDFGATDGGPNAVAAYPASDPLVTSVGGTQGLPYPNGLLHGRRGSYGGEQVWNEGDIFDAATGGAPSVLFRAPFWQRDFSHLQVRATPDVAFDAAIDGGVVITIDGFVTLIGGTSVGSPSWAAILALANENRANAHMRPIGFANPELYAVARDPRQYRRDYHDIVVGSNALDSDIGFSAVPGYDLATGLGTPDVSTLLGDLVGRAGGAGDDPGDPGQGRSWPGRGRSHRHPGQ